MTAIFYEQDPKLGTLQYSDLGLLFIAHHSVEEAQKLNVELGAPLDAPVDPGAVATIVGEQVTIAPTTSGTFSTFKASSRYSSFTMKLPNTTRKGKLYYRTQYPPAVGETSQFWIQQIPPYIGGDGRLVIEFWNNQRIQAVFKSDDNNFGALGTGTWGA